MSVRLSGAVRSFERTLVLHDHPSSSNCLKVRILLAELDLDYERRHVPMAWPRPTWHTSLQPAGTVPLLVDGATRVGDSNSILRYLAGREGRDDLYPPAARDRVAVDWAIDLWAVDVRPTLLALEHACLWAADPEHGSGRAEDGDQSAIATATPAAVAGLDIYERFLDDSGHAALGRPTIADWCVLPVAWRAQRLPLPHDRWPRLGALTTNGTARPSFVEAGPVV